MCGIAGIINSTGDVPSHALLESMGDSLAHRGPDACGYRVWPGVGFAHRRLSIIDLSSRADQPMSTSAGDFTVTYNGEIYNYRELAQALRDAGRTFFTQSDTEVLLHAYSEYGPECLQRFNGMFAFALWDSPRRRLFAARDRLGIKPFYYWFDGATLVFASEIKALLCHPAVSVRPNWDSIRDYLLFSHPLNDETWYLGIRQLPPGCYLTFENGILEIHRYWGLTLEPDYTRSFADFRDELRGLVADAVHLQLRSDVPVGAHLSGGVDSSSIVALASHELPGRLHTFSAAFEGGSRYDERRYIRIVSDRFSTMHHDVVPLSADLPSVLPRLLWHLDQPVIGSAILPMYYVSGLAANAGVRVVNGGQGADELFGGYPPFYVHAVRNLLQAGSRSEGAPFSEFLRIPGYLLRGGAWARVRARWKVSSSPVWLRSNSNLRHETVEKWEAAASPVGSRMGSFEKAAYVALKFYLPGLLHQEDRMSMAWSIESRVPLLDHRVVELAARIPSWMKVRGGVLKYIFREAMRQITPDAILNRRDKMGYPTPLKPWFAGPLKEYMRACIGKRDFLSSEVVDPNAVSAMLERHGRSGCDYSGALWKILTLELWLQGVSEGWTGLRERPHLEPALPA